jgi:hypothetical protein
MRQIDFYEFKRGVSNRAFQGSTISKGLDIIFSVDVDVHLVPAEEQRHTDNEVSNYSFLKCNMEKSEYTRHDQSCKTGRPQDARVRVPFRVECALSCYGKYILKTVNETLAVPAHVRSDL